LRRASIEHETWKGGPWDAAMSQWNSRVCSLHGSKGLLSMGGRAKPLICWGCRVRTWETLSRNPQVCRGEAHKEVGQEGPRRITLTTAIKERTEKNEFPAEEGPGGSVFFLKRDPLESQADGGSEDGCQNENPSDICSKRGGKKLEGEATRLRC